MEMNNFSRGESHVSQQSRMNKLRFQNSENLEERYSSDNSLEQLWANPGIIKYGAISQEPNCFSSDVVSTCVYRNEAVLSSGNVSVVNLSHPVSSNPNLSTAKVGDPENSSNWKSLGTNQTSDRIVDNYYDGTNNPTSNSGSGSIPMFSRGDGLCSFKGNNISPASVHMKQPNCDGYNHDMLRSSNMVASPSPYNYHNTLQEVVTSANVGVRGGDVVRYGGKDADELVLPPSYNDHDQANQVHSCNASSTVWVNRPVEVSPNWNGEDLANRSVREHMMTCTQGLSLSLSSASQTHKRRDGQFGERNDLTDYPLESKLYESDYLCSSSRRSVGKKVYGTNWQNTVGIPPIAPRDAAGPLGPFTGYSTILKNSKYLKPTLQLIDELFHVTVTKQIEAHEGCLVKNSHDCLVSAADHAVYAAGDSMVRAKDGDSGASSSSLYSSNVAGGEAGCGSNAGEFYHPEYYQKKTKLLHMQEELHRRNRLYHQQMQMVVASFESVAGLSTAVPYISVALKTVSRHFRCLKQVISEQLRNMGRTLREELSSPTAGTSSSIKCDASTLGLRLTEHQKQKSCGSAMILFEPHQPVWRPQRGLPERAVAVLRAWLFDHFLHPYPTDTDKHMLATQTGLTRNQVSNWFINARVRVWKPMVEEIHVLETKGSAESSSQMGKPDGNAASSVSTNQYNIQPIDKLCGIDSSKSRGMTSAEAWDQEKRSRHDFQIPSAINVGSLMSFIPYQQGGLEIGSGLGAVSLTLGLRQSAESAHQQQQQDQYRQHFGGHMINDFVG